jgi:hypothetical protein
MAEKPREASDEKFGVGEARRASDYSRRRIAKFVPFCRQGSMEAGESRLGAGRAGGHEDVIGDDEADDEGLDSHSRRSSGMQESHTTLHASSRCAGDQPPPTERELPPRSPSTPANSHAGRRPRRIAEATSSRPDTKLPQLRRGPAAQPSIDSTGRAGKTPSGTKQLS